MNLDQPHIITFPSHGASNQGFITVAECEKAIPFTVERVYWTYYTPNNIERGGHAHHELFQVLIAVSGIIDITTEDRAGNKQTFLLNSPDKGLLLPPPFWHTMRFSHNAVLLSLCNMHYDEADYIRSYEVFKASK
ncbi:MAG: FdtA/QdtA family cupin domain-containing protein [Bacteroidetes bacterium]|nr:FdtA/QdtA family cupin domain-containing protein [Bacteroidota bacterium]